MGPSLKKYLGTKKNDQVGAKSSSNSRSKTIKWVSGKEGNERQLQGIPEETSSPPEYSLEDPHDDTFHAPTPTPERFGQISRPEPPRQVSTSLPVITRNQPLFQQTSQGLQQQARPFQWEAEMSATYSTPEGGQMTYAQEGPTSASYGRQGVYAPPRLSRAPTIPSIPEQQGQLVPYNNNNNQAPPTELIQSLVQGGLERGFDRQQLMQHVEQRHQQMQMEHQRQMDQIQNQMEKMKMQNEMQLMRQQQQALQNELLKTSMEFKTHKQLTNAQLQHQQQMTQVALGQAQKAATKASKAKKDKVNNKPITIQNTVHGAQSTQTQENRQASYGGCGYGWGWGGRGYWGGPGYYW